MPSALFMDGGEARCKQLPSNQLPVRFVVLEIIFQHEFSQDALRHIVQSIEHICSGYTVAAKAVQFPFISLEEQIERFYRYNLLIGQIAFVVEKSQRNAIHRWIHCIQVLLQVSQAFEVCFEAIPLRVRDKHDAVYTTENELPGCVIHYLPRHCPKLESHFEAFHHTTVDW